MLERYFVRPDTIDRIRASWIAEGIERYVAWLTEEAYSPRCVSRRVPLLMKFGEFAAYSTQTDRPLRPHADHRFRSMPITLGTKRRSGFPW
ncbi:MAG: hypothetical protein Kow00129_16770 [Thermoleophilia bacterium]